jgi:hypothetical protein
VEKWDKELDKVMDKQMEEVKKVMSENKDADKRESLVAEVNTKYSRQIQELKLKQEKSAVDMQVL